MKSNFDRRYQQAAADRLRREAVARGATENALSQIERARELAGPVIADFAASAVKILRTEGVPCRDGWPLPGIDQDVTCTMDRHRSGLFRKAWTYQSSYGFLTLSKDGSLRPTSIFANVRPEDALYAEMAVGGQEVLQSVRSKYESDSNGVRTPQLLFNTGLSLLTVVWESPSGQVEVKQFMDYGASAVESLVAGWRNRKV